MKEHELAPPAWVTSRLMQPELEIETPHVHTYIESKSNVKKTPKNIHEAYQYSQKFIYLYMYIMSKCVST